MRLMTNDELEAVSGGLMSVKSRGDFKGTKPSKPAGSKEQMNLSWKSQKKLQVTHMTMMLFLIEQRWHK
jgi:hypothetical protein